MEDIKRLIENYLKNSQNEVIEPEFDEIDNLKNNGEINITFEVVDFEFIESFFGGYQKKRKRIKKNNRNKEYGNN